MMDVKKDHWMKQLFTSCPNCQKNILYCGNIISKITDLNSKEVLFCKTCKFVVPDTEYKKMLFAE